jgi:hypothetical protein
MALKTQWQQNAHRALRFIGRFYRWMGWLGLVATAFFTLYAFVTHWNMLSRGFGVDFIHKLWQSFLVGGLVLAFGLFLCAMAFVVSLFIEVGSRMMENSFLQTDLLRRLVREQTEGDHDLAAARLMEHNADEDDLSPEYLHENAERR